MTRTRAMLGIMMFAAVGSLVGIAIDCVVSSSTALVYRISEVVDRLTDYRIAPAVVLVLTASALTGVGAASVLYVRPLGRKGAFGCGFCVIAALSLVTP